MATCMLKVIFGRLKQICDNSIIHFDHAQSSFSKDEKECSIRSEKLKANRVSVTEDRGKNG